MLSSGLFTGVCSLSVSIVEHSVGMKYTSYLLAYEDGTDRVFQNVGT
jgi:hypothetical protein